MAKTSGKAQNAIVRIWRAFGLKPHLQENFKLSTRSVLRGEVRDIIGLQTASFWCSPPGRQAAHTKDWAKRRNNTAIRAGQRLRPRHGLGPEREAEAIIRTHGLLPERRCAVGEQVLQFAGVGSASCRCRLVIRVCARQKGG